MVRNNVATVLPRLSRPALAASLAWLLLAAPDAASHGEYDWIRQRGYESVRGGPCCGVDDCYKVHPRNVVVDGDTYSVPDWGASFPIDRTLPSEDEFFWMCLDPEGVRCFFAPLGGV